MCTPIYSLVIGTNVPRYDIVCIEEDKDKVMKLQEGLSDWKPSMTSVGLLFVSLAFTVGVTTKSMITYLTYQVLNRLCSR